MKRALFYQKGSKLGFELKDRLDKDGGSTYFDDDLRGTARMAFLIKTIPCHIPPA